MHRDKVESFALIESHRIHVVVRGDQPDAPAVLITGDLRQFAEQCCPDPQPRTKRVHGDQLALASVDIVGDQANWITFDFRDQSGQFRRDMDSPAGHDFVRSPMVVHHPKDKLLVSFGSFTNGYCRLVCHQS